ncbi:MAG TPA: hypothetical protein VJP77_08520, partial [Planctomycetota bacterium]|nr:hypothetical protein [Planctomycetota bacterium]
FVIFFIILSALLGSCCLITVLRETVANIRFICLIPFYLSRWFLEYCRPHTYNNYDPDTDSLIDSNRRDSKRLSKKPYWYKAPILLLAILPGVSCGTEVASLIATSEECRRTFNQSSCTLNSATTLTLLPAGQTVTLLIRNDQNLVLGAINFIVQSLTMNCLPKTEKWLRSYEIMTEAVKRCPRMGSCKGSFCDEVQIDSIIPELNISNQFPGNSYCLGSCSFWWCKCALPTSACIFYRNYASPTSENIYEVVSCPSWEFRINLIVSIELTGQTPVSENISLTPGITSKWNDLSFTSLTVSQAPTPVLTEHFITDGINVALFDSNIHVDLHCPDEISAVELNCTLIPTSCINCRPNPDTLVSCKCRHLLLENILHNPQMQLPLTSGKISLRNDLKEIFSESTYAPIQILVTMENFKLIAEIDQTTCTIFPKKLSGCYKCNTGGEFSYECHTNFGISIAEITCEDGTIFISHCESTT